MKSSDSRRIPRTDRPGSGAYRGPVREGVAFDDYRAADEKKARHRGERPSLWHRFTAYLRTFGKNNLDRELLLAAQESLARDPTIETSRIDLQVWNGELQVSGTVTSRWMKQKVNERLQQLPEIKSVKNNLRIRPQHPKLPQEGSLSKLAP